MANKLRKLLALIMALSLCMSLLSVTALADEPEGGSPKAEEPAEGTKENPKETTSTTTTTDEHGNPKVVEKVTKEWTETRVDEESGESKEYKVTETTETTTVTDDTKGAEIPAEPTITQPPLDENGVTIDLENNGKGQFEGEASVKPGITEPETGKTTTKDNGDGTTTVTTTVEETTGPVTSEDGKTTTTVTDKAERVSEVTNWALSATLDTSRLNKPTFNEDGCQITTGEFEKIDFEVVKTILKAADIDIGTTSEADLITAIQQIKNNEPVTIDRDWVKGLANFLNPAAVPTEDEKPEIEISDVTFTVISKIEVEEVEDETSVESGNNTKTPDKYNTTVEFKVEVKKLSTNELKVTVSQEGTDPQTFTIDQESMTNGIYNVTLENLVLMVDTPVNINVGLKGTQEINKDLSGEIGEICDYCNEQLEGAE